MSSEENVRYPGAGVTGGCKPPSVGAQTQTQELYVLLIAEPKLFVLFCFPVCFKMLTVDRCFSVRGVYLKCIFFSVKER